MNATAENPMFALTHDDLRRLAPGAFAEAPGDRMSDRYRFTSTRQIIDVMFDSGYLPVRASQSLSRTGQSEIGRHMIRFRPLRFLDNPGLGAEFPELVVTNSHDGSSALSISAGVFRLICLNGAVVGTGPGANFKVQHVGDRGFAARAMDAIKAAADGAEAAMLTVKDWKGITIDVTHQAAMAQAALEVKGNPAFGVRQLLAPRRECDAMARDGSRDLWTTFNVVQEGIIRGGLEGISPTGQTVRSRPITAVQAEMRLNRALWTISQNLFDSLN
jgi:hypothetical protein